MTQPQPRDPRSRAGLLWREARPPSRGPKPKLTLWQIAECAIAIADADGLDAVSMQRVASELGYTPMSLYRYVSSKDDLLDIMLDVASGQPPAYTGDPDDWRAEIEAWAERIWEMYWQHPWATAVEIVAAPNGPNQLEWFEAALRPLSRSGLPDEDLVSATLFLLGAVRQLASLAISIVTARKAAGVTATEAERGYEAELQEFITPDRFPVLTRLAESGIFGPSGEVGEQDAAVGIDMRFGVQRLLDGIEAYVEKRTS